MIQQAILNYFTSVKYFFRPEYKAQSYDLHFYYSILVGIPCGFFAFHFMQLNDTPLLFKLFLGGFFLFGVNFVREWYRVYKFGIKEDFVDVHFGSYGGIVAALIVELIYNY
jgi:hypothetical protein